MRVVDCLTEVYSSELAKIVTVYVPKGAVAATLNEAWTVPEFMGSEHVAGGDAANRVAGRAVIVQPVSDAAKPVPVTWTKVP